MSFIHDHDDVRVGDTMMLYLGHSSLLSVEMTSDGITKTKYGSYKHKDMIGRPYGSKAFSADGKRWLYMLHPTPESWTITLPHRTQILYSTDIAMVTMKLDLRPGAVVVESGTGSGSLSHAIIRSIMPSGHLHTFDFHQQRVDTIRQEFDSHQLGSFVTSECRDVCADGFGLSSIADAVFLDLPKPWEAIESAKDALKKSGSHLCSFSPCIEQVQRTCLTLASLGFTEIETLECLRREFDVKKMAMKTILFQSQTDDNQCVDESNLPPNLQLSAGLMLEKPEALTARPFKSMPGHTGYLTFASLYE